MNTWVIARGTFGEAIRKRIGLYVLFTTLIFIVLSQLFASLSVQGSIASKTAQSGNVEVTVIKSMAFGIIVLAGLVLSIFLSFDLIPSDVDKKTIYTILSKPVWRWQYVLGKFVGTSLALGVNIALMGVALLVLVFLKTGQLETPLLAGVLLLYLQFVLLAGFSIFLSLVVSRNINVAVCFAIYIMGMVSEFWQDVAKATPVPYIQWLAKFMHLAIPNIYNFNVTNSLIHMQNWREIPSPSQDVFLVALYGILWCAVVMVLASAIFSRKEV
ncbi:MAG TPA: ABC transporter permease subunit [Armatimonadota bacterium]|jgi:ABC-type transport system involved in multi-copper enzyme maturation permease subunit